MCQSIKCHFNNHDKQSFTQANSSQQSTLNGIIWYSPQDIVTGFIDCNVFVGVLWAVTSFVLYEKFQQLLHEGGVLVVSRKIVNIPYSVKQYSDSECNHKTRYLIQVCGLQRINVKQNI